MKKVIITILVLIIISIIFVIFKGKATSPATLESSVEHTSGHSEENTRHGISVGEPNPQAEKMDIIYTDSGFNPSSITVKKGESVTFINKSGRAFWPAAGDHPNHLSYPEFDSKRPIEVGESYTFRFDKIGTWAFHNHLNDDHMGIIIVK